MTTYGSDPQSQRAGKRVWHYTDFTGLEGILNGKIWASSIAYLNDTQEFRYALGVANSVLDEEKEQFTKSVSAEACESLVRFFQEADGKGTFVSSFSSEEDDLSQWRAYGGTGPSFAIGFDLAHLAKKAADVHFDLMDVWYDHEKIEEVLRSAVREIGLKSQSTPAARNPDLYRNISFGVDMIGTLFSLAARCKHLSFGHEREWRLIRRLSDRSRESKLEMNFRQRGSLIIPYVEVPLHEPSLMDPAAAFSPTKVVDSPVVAIMIGPSPHPDELRHAVGDMVLRKGLHVDLNSSKVPFRNW